MSATEEIVYIAQNAELSKRHAGKIAFKVGHTIGTPQNHERGLNRGTQRILKYAGATLTENEPWVIVAKILGTPKFEDTIHDSLDAVRLPNYFSQLRKPVGQRTTAVCDELYAVPADHPLTYLIVGETIDFTESCREMERKLRAAAKRAKRQRQ